MIPSPSHPRIKIIMLGEKIMKFIDRINIITIMIKYFKVLSVDIYEVVKFITDKEIKITVNLNTIVILLISIGIVTTRELIVIKVISIDKEKLSCSIIGISIIIHSKKVSRVMEALRGAE